MQQDRYGQVKTLRPAVFRDHVGNLPRSAARRSREARATSSVGKTFAPCMIPGTSTQKRGLPGKIRALCIRNRPIAPRNGYMGRRSCHSSQSNLEDRHNESIGRQNANPKKDPGTTAKSPNAKATLTRPLFLAARSNTQTNLSPRRFPQGHQSSQHETISKTAQHQGSLEKSCLRKLIRRSSMST